MDVDTIQDISPPRSRSNVPLSLESAVERGIAGGIAAVGGLLTKQLAEFAKPADPAAPRPDNRALGVAIAALLLVAVQWAWSGSAHTNRMNTLEDRVDGIESGVDQVGERLSSIERAQIRLTYATTAIAAKVGATIPD